MNYNDDGTVKQITVKAGDTLPVGTEVDYDGETVPNGYVEIPNPNLFNGTTMVSGKGLNGTTGQPYEVASRSYYEYMEVEAYTTYVLADITPASICFYNSTETFISSVSGATIFTTPADTYYVRVAFNNTVPYSSASLKKRKIEDTKRIRKTYNGVVPNGKILNSYSTSQNDGYSCEYINNDLNTYSTEEQRIGTYLGKPLYRKTINTYTLNSEDVETLAVYDFSNDSTFINTILIKNFNLSVTLQYRTTNNYFEKGLGNNGNYIGTFGFNHNRGDSPALNVLRETYNQAYIIRSMELTIEYTKTTD